MDTINEIFAKNLKHYRSKANLTQSQLSEKSEVSLGYIGELEVGRRNPSFQTLAKIADVLNIKVYQLFVSDEDFETFSRNELLDKIGRDLEDRVASGIRETLKRYRDKA